jgi:O-antigen ligase
MSYSGTLTEHNQSNLKFRALLGITAIEILVLCLPPKWSLIGVLGLLAIVALFGVCISVVRGRGDLLILGWALVFPLGYYYFAYPEVHPVITLDRVFIGILMVTVCFSFGREHTPLPRTLQRLGWWWVAFLFFAAITIPATKVPLNSLRTLLDGFIFPTFLAWFVFRYVDVRSHLSKLHLITCVMAIYVGAIGVAEVALHRDLLVMPDSAVFLAGDYNDNSSEIIIRPNGPFSTTNSYALIGVTTFFFLSFLKEAAGSRLSWWREWLHRLARAAALATAIMPIFRSMFLALGIILFADVFYTLGKRRAVRIAALTSFLVVALAVRAALPMVFEERSDPGNLFGRLAEQRQVMAMFMDHPLNGVGLNNFYYEASVKGKYRAFYGDIESVDYPHNNFGAVLAETGLTGFVPYFVSQVLLVVAFWKIYRSHLPESKLIWTTFLYIFLGYWINGMSLASGYYSDLNLWYLLVIAILMKFAVSQNSETHPRLSLL